jgi:hypothetical protein
MQIPQEKQVVRIRLTDEQQDLLKRATGRDCEAIELTIEELEERIAPRLASNHNETMLVE